MGGHPDAFVRISKKLSIAVRHRAETTDPDARDELTRYINKWLDEWVSYRYMATEWDAYMWGFPDDWMHDIRRKIERAPMTKGWDGRWYERKR